MLFAGIISNLSRKNKTDRITGLFNKMVYREETQRLITRRPDTPLAIMQLGLDDFKHINDLYDRSFGDEVLRISAQRIMSLLPENAEVYRLDGDEFGILISGCQPEAIRGIYKKPVSYTHLVQPHDHLSSRSWRLSEPLTLLFPP